VPVPDPSLAALWYQRAIAYLPGYVKARVHLAEIYASQGHTGDAEALLLPALSSHDPEVRWRLADALIDKEGSKRARGSLTPHGPASMTFLANIFSPSRTMPQSSTPAAATTTGGRLNLREPIWRIVRHAVRSSRRMRSR